MQHDTPNGWEPDPQRMGNWQSMFERDRSGKPTGAPPPSAQGEMSREQPTNDDGPELDLSVYKPWILQRGVRPTMMLHLRRHEPKSGLWMGWQLAYHTLIAAEYVGERMLSLDFGTRQFVIEGAGLNELARHLQQGSVQAVQEYSAKIWPQHPDRALIDSIKQVSS